jgi:uncharacterized protein involved in exopolysaccharide biosynthesis
MADDFHEMDLRVIEEPGILDMGVLLAENAWMVIGSALAGAVLAFLLALLLPRTYESTSLLKFTEADAAVIRSADVLVPVIKELNLLRDDPLDVALEKLDRKISAVFRKKDAALQVSTRGETPEAAQLLNVKVLDAVRQFVLPKGRSLEAVEEQIRITSGTLEELRAAIQRVGKNVDKVTPGTEAEAMTRSYVVMVEQRDARAKQLFDLRAALKKTGPEVVLQAATLPTKPVKPRKALFALGGAVLFGVASLAFVFIRRALALASSSPSQYEKIRRIQNALSFRLQRQRSSRRLG